MTDLSINLLPRLNSRRLPGLDLGSEAIHPDYSGGSIFNLPNSLCRLFEIADFGQSSPLSAEILAPLIGITPSGGDAIHKVLLVLLDALSWRRFTGWIGEGRAPVWTGLSNQGVLAPLTSIVPSTTSAALTSLWSGKSPAEHGIVGYEMWLKEYGVVANMITHAPITFVGDAGSLSQAGFKPQDFLPWETLGIHLNAHGIETHAFQHRSIARSGLSEMYFRKVSIHPFNTQTDLWINLRKLFERQAAGHFFSWVYWGELDHLSHFYGPDDERPAEEFASFSSTFERLFLDRLSPAARQGTAIVVTADHGQITTRPDPHYDLSNHPGLARRLHILPTGENRMMFLYVRPGQIEAVREYIQRTWPNQFISIDPAYAANAGLFGLGATHPALLDRMGDLLVVAQGEAYLWWSNKENHLIGRHGGLSPDEMLVPFLAARL
jgi:hypothetical protein